MPPEPSFQDPGLIATDVARFIPAGVDPAAIPRSFALVEPLPALEPVPDSWSTRPCSVRTTDGFEASIAVEAGTSLYGTGEIAGPLLRNGTVTEVWAKQPFRVEDDGTIVPNYDDRSTSLYQAHPWVLAVRRDGSAFGALADTTYRLGIDLRRGIRFTCAEPFPILVFEGASPQAVVRRLAELTGKIELPPRWALGYQQCRFSYYPDARIRALADDFRKRAIPCDVIWIDIHYMDEYKVFTFDPTRFPKPKGTNDYLHARGFRSVWILDPAVKAEVGYPVYDEGVSEDHFLRDPDGHEYHGTTWAGDAAFPDFTCPRTRAWWKRLTEEFLEQGIDGVWVDLNEPSLILPFGAEVPEGLRHRGGNGLLPGTHAQYHNVYGMLMAKTTHEAMLAARPERRPFVLSRANYVGGQRYAAAWTGDNTSTWSHLYWSVPMVLNLGLSGQPFSGPDIGGFAGTPSPALFAHWIGVGAFFPFSRTHNALSGDQEPWSFGPATETIAQVALERRYRLLPYLYTLFREAAMSGLPVMRPVFFADPTDLALRREDHAFLLGSDVLVMPRLLESETHSFQMPKGSWRPFLLAGEDSDAEPAHPSLRLRDGAILPVGPGGQTTDEAFNGPLTLVVSLDETGHAEGVLYEDLGEGFGYVRGQYLLTTYEADLHGNQVEIRITDEEGDLPRPERPLQIELLTDAAPIRRTGRDGEPIAVALVDAPNSSI